MKKILTIAWREFTAVVATKGFIAAILLPPVFMGIALMGIPLLMNQKAPKVSGHVAVIDRSGLVGQRLADAFDPAKQKARRAEKIKEGIEQGTKKLGLGDEVTKEAVKQSAEAQDRVKAALPEPDAIEIRMLPPDTDPEVAKQEILKSTGREQADENADARLALVVIPKESVLKDPTAENAGYSGYDMLVAPRLDVEVQGDLKEQTGRAIVDARLEAGGFSVEKVRELLQNPKSQSKAVTKDGERKTSEVAAFLVPGAFMFLLWISVFSAGQYLLTGTIEEKSNRVMEVLLSAASPMEVMIGKILGKGAVGALILVLYSSAGITALVAAAMTHLVAWQTLVYVAVYFVIAYFIIASLMAAVGSAVNEIAEAQSLMAPIMMILIVPMLLWMPIMRNPNSTFAQVCSFVPLINPFVMVLRVSGSEPVPMWQIPASMLVGVITVVVMVYLAAKIFRIGVLMYGKPPNFATLIRWVRMA